MTRRTRLLSTLIALSLALPVAAAQAAPAAPAAHRLTRTLLPAPLLAHRVGPAPASRPWHVGVSIRGRDAAGLARLERAQQTPGSPDYRRFLTPAEFASRFGARPADVAAVRRWATAQGLRVTAASGDGSYLTLAGTVGQVQRTFGTTIGRYAARGQTYLANDRPPLVPAAVTAVSGLDEVSGRLRTRAVAAFPLPADTTPQALWRVYEQPASNRGRGQQLAAFGWGSPDGVTDDLRLFEERNGLRAMPFRVVQVGQKGTDTAGRIEWNLDSQAASGMAPDAAGMTFYFGASGNVDLLAAAIFRWADDPRGAKQASGSYGLCEVFATLGVLDGHERALTQAAVEGRSFFASSGDAGSGCSAVVGVNGVVYGPIPSQEYPASSPHAVGVGGTVLYTTASGAREQEIVWTHTGGGPSYVYPTPAWQKVALASTRRGVADVAAQSGDLLSGYRIVSAGRTQSVGGTSLSAPLWQGMWARINAAAPRGRDGVPNLGYANPVLYANNADPARYARDFNDITVGVNGAYTALPGYDFPTGWGTPRVANLMRDLTGRTTPR